jgi:gamma-glutamylcyclotransferase
VLYLVKTEQLQELDRFEGKGYGYERRCVTAYSASGERLEADTCIATQIDPSLRPSDWYKEHVVRGAKDSGLPADYVAMIEAVVANVDPDTKRRARELVIYG